MEFGTDLLVFLCFLAHTSVNIDPDEGFLTNRENPVLTVMSAGHALHVFVNGQLAGVLTCLAFGMKWKEFPKMRLSSYLDLPIWVYDRNRVWGTRESETDI